MSKGHQSFESESIHSVLAQIKDKKIDPINLSSEDRRRCIEVLKGEGYSVAEMAQVLKKNERTIYRDWEQIRSDNALVPDPEFAPKMAGETMRQAEISMSRQRRIAREPNASAMERLMAEQIAWKTFKEMIEKLQSLGYLPTAAIGVNAEIHHSGAVAAIPGYELLESEALRITNIARQQHLESAASIQLLDDIRRAKMFAQLEDLDAKQGKDGTEAAS